MINFYNERDTDERFLVFNCWEEKFKVYKRMCTLQAVEYDMAIYVDIVLAGMTKIYIFFQLLF